MLDEPQGSLRGADAFPTGDRFLHVAVLGAGIMGSATALLLARRGVRVTLFDAAERPFARASRWNEGKIHLGHLYAGDRSLATARRVLPGGLAFKSLTESLIGCSLEGAVTPHDDVYLVHRDSVADAEATERYLEWVTAMALEHPDARRYLVDLSSARTTALSRRELAADYDTATVVAGFRVPERSVSTVWVADRFADALVSTDRVELVLSAYVRAVRSSDGSLRDPMFVDTDRGRFGPFDFVVNALWEDRLRVDGALGLPRPPLHNHRFRLSAFVRTRRPVSVASAVVATGPFGDVKNYNGRDLYLSWYPAGLIAEGDGVAPPRLPELDAARRERIGAEILRELGRVVYGIRDVEAAVERVQVEGGWVYAAGGGSLADPTSTLHRRDRVGITRSGSYFSVDTGKYSIAPWLAAQVAREICDGA